MERRGGGMTGAPPLRVKYLTIPHLPGTRTRKGIFLETKRGTTDTGLRFLLFIFMIITDLILLKEIDGIFCGMI